MRVDVGVAVAGKVLRRRDGAGVGESTDEECREPSDALRAFPERPCVDHRIVRVVVDVDDGCKINLDTDSTRFLANGAGDVACVLVAIRRRDGHVARKDGRAPRVEQIVGEDTSLEATETGLEIGRRDQWDTCDALHRVDLRRDLDRRTEGHAHAADVILLDPTSHFGEAGVAVAGVVTEHPHHHHLADALAQRQRSERAVDPPPLRGGERDARAEWDDRNSRAPRVSAAGGGRRRSVPGRACGHAQRERQ